MGSLWLRLLLGASHFFNLTALELRELIASFGRVVVALRQPDLFRLWPPERFMSAEPLTWR